MRSKQATAFLIITLALAACPAALVALTIGNPSAANNWDTSASTGAVGDPSQANNWDTTSAVSIRAWSSQHDFRPWTRTIDGSGLDPNSGTLHGNDGANTMALSSVATYPNTVRGGTVAGYVWVEYDLGSVYNLGALSIWNYNELNYPWFGFKEVTIEYSTTGSTNPADWTTIYDGTIPESAGGGLNPTPVDLDVNFAGAAAQYVVITADNPPDHNHKPDQLDDCGLSEVRFNLPAAVTVTASSSHGSRPAVNTINGSGIDPTGLLHDQTPTNMWLSGVFAASAPNVNPGTVPGAHWIRFDFDRLYTLQEMWIWNYAENQYANFGMNEVTIEYSAAANPGPGDWSTIFAGNLGIAHSNSSTNDTNHETTVIFNNTPARAVVITSPSDQDWNFFPEFQGIEEVGLSEVRFFAADPPADCAAAIEQGHGLPGDADQNCYVNLIDLALLTDDWLNCIDPTDQDCTLP